MLINPHAHLADRLLALLRYDEAAGKVFWIGGRHPGKEAGSPCFDGYLRLHTLGKAFLIHRVVWLHHYRVWPAQQLDHINGDKLDNRVVNLREVDHRQNLQNQKRSHKNNRSGFLGVRDRGNGSFWAYIKVDGKHKYLGSFRSPEVAHQAYMDAKAQFHIGS